MVTKGEKLRAKKFKSKHVEDATSLVLMLKREIYEKLINKKSEGDVTKRGRFKRHKKLISKQLQKIRNTVKGCSN